MADSKIAKCLILCLMGLSTFARGLSISAAPSGDASQGVNLSSSDLRPAILSDSWPVKRLISNSTGDLAFAGGDFMGGADGLVLIKGDGVVKIAALGDPVPESTGLFLTTVGNKGYRDGDLYGDFSLNGLGQLAFSANVVSCTSSSEVARCAAFAPRLEGLFVFTETSRRTIALQGDPAPGADGAVFSSFERVLINNRGMIVFFSRITRPDGMEANGIFSFSQGVIVRIVALGEPTPFGDIAPNPWAIFLNDEGAVTFRGFIQGGPDYSLFRYENGALSKLVSPGDRGPGGGSLSGIASVDANSRGDVVFQSKLSGNEGLFLRGIDGTISQIITGRDITPIGGQFVLQGMCSLRNVTVPLSPKLNDSGEVLFASPIRGANAEAAVFLFSHGAITKVVADGDPFPSAPDSRVRIESTHLRCGGANAEFLLNNMGMAAIATGITGREGLSELFTYTKGNLVKLFSTGDAAPGTGGESFVPPGPKVTDPQTGFSLSDSGVVAFHAPLCCGKFKEGVFIAGPSRSSIPNGDFEIPGDSGLPAGWTITWNNSGSGDAFQYNSGGGDSFDGNSVLRLHVGAGGGSTFVLSDPIPVSPGAVYPFTCQMRYNFAYDSDAAYFSIIQYDSGGNSVGFDEIAGIMGDNFWTWVTNVLPVRTMPTAASIRIRFGLASKSESYLDVDAVR